MARPGRTSEITACRHHRLTARLRAAGLGAVADLGFVGLDDSGSDVDPAVITGYKAARNRPLTRGQKLTNKALAAVRAPVEHGFAHLKNWRVLGKVHTDPKWATALVRALLVLTNREVSRWPTIFAEVVRPRPARASRTSGIPVPRPATSRCTPLSRPGSGLSTFGGDWQSALLRGSTQGRALGLSLSSRAVSR
ncbi:transposase family protein [Streptomyces sp. NBC_00076]|uniref:transposase family protein n=1 Tax=Streptomyces sp. NBC_00076 TaxID=2975642 RepID=UPI003243844C